MFAAEMRRKRVSDMQGFPRWRWHLDEMYVRLSGEMVYLERAVDTRARSWKAYVTRSRDKAAALAFMKRR